MSAMQYIAVRAIASLFLSITALLAFTWGGNAQASSVAVLVKDINTTRGPNGDSRGLGLAELNGKVYFSAHTSDSGQELWTTDGTEAGTHIVKDIWPGPEGSNAARFAVMNGEVYFGASDPGRGWGLWKSDGTKAGTQWVTAVAGSDRVARGNATAIYAYNNLLWIFLKTSAHTSLYVSDGTAAGTKLVANVDSATVSLEPPIIGMDGVLYFVAGNGIKLPLLGSGDTLWRSDGTASGTYKVDASVTGMEFQPVAAVASGKVFFSAGSVEIADREMWVFDGTKFYQLNPASMRAVGVGGGFPLNFVPFNGKLYFSAFDSNGNLELWKSDGTEPNTTIVKHINAAGSSSVVAVGSFNGRLYFGAYDGATYGLYSSEGSSADVERIAEVPGGPGNLRVGSQLAFFTVYDSTSDTYSLWRTDGTGTGTFEVRDHTRLSDAIVAADSLYYSFDDGEHGNELWTSDGSTSGTRLTADIQPSAADSEPSELTPFAGGVLLDANDAAHGTELWSSDGTSLHTQLVEDINPGTEGSSPSGLIIYQGKALFSADAEGRLDLWSTDGTSGSAHIDSAISDVTGGGTFGDGAVIDGKLFFTQGAMWASDGTTTGTVNLGVAPSSSLTCRPDFAVLGHAVYMYGAGEELYTTDGTSAGTAAVTNLNDGIPDCYLYAAGNSLFLVRRIAFDIATHTSSFTLYLSGGKPSDAILALDFTVPGNLSASEQAGVLGDDLIFAADGGDGAGYEVWISNGTVAGTRLLKDATPGAAGSYPHDFMLFDGKLYFGASDGSHGDELWVTDGTTAGTKMVKDIVPGGDSSYPRLLGVYAAHLYFAAEDQDKGYELFASDGTSDGTRLATDIDAGSGNGNPGVPDRGTEPTDFAVTETAAYFAADDGQHGRELWKVHYNDSPVAMDGTITTKQGTRVDGTLAAADANGDSLTYAVTKNPAHGELTMLDATKGSYTYTPDAGFSGSDSFIFKANDGVDDSDEATIGITVTPKEAADAPSPHAPANGGGGGGCLTWLGLGFLLLSLAGHRGRQNRA